MKRTYRYPDGSEYSGDWQEGQRHGYGVMKFPDGSKYCGIFDNGLCQGNGAMSFSDKSQYVYSRNLYMIEISVTKNLNRDVLEAKIIYRITLLISY